MNLKTVHIVFVTCSSLLAFLFGGWCLAQEGGGYTALGILALFFALAMIAYGVWFWRKITTPEEERERRRKLFRTVSIVAPVLLLWSHRAAFACSVCYGEAEGPWIDAARLGVFLLFGLVFAIQGSFVAFFVYLRRRARKYRAAQDQAAVWRPALRSR